MKLPEGSDDSPPTFGESPADEALLARTILQMSQLQITLLQKVTKIEADQRAIMEEFRRERSQSQTFLELLNKRHESEVDRLLKVIKWGSESQQAQVQQRPVSAAGALSTPVVAQTGTSSPWMSTPAVAARAIGPSMAAFGAASSPSSFFGGAAGVEESPLQFWQQQQQHYLACLQQHQQMALQHQFSMPPSSGAVGASSLDSGAAAFGVAAGNATMLGQQSFQPDINASTPSKPTTVTNISSSVGGFPGVQFPMIPRMAPPPSAPSAVQPTAASTLSLPRTTATQPPMFSSASASAASLTRVDNRPIGAAVDFSVPKSAADLSSAVVKPEASKGSVVPTSLFGFARAAAAGATPPPQTMTAAPPPLPLGGTALILRAPQTHTTFSFFNAKPDADVSSSQSIASPTKSDHQGEDETPEHFEPSAHFQPVVPLPDLVEATTGEENEKVVFTERCKLFRYANETKEWKERGVGDLKILQNPETKIYRIVMRRDQVLKVCANHTIQAAMSLMPMQKSDRAYVWLAQDFSEGQVSEEKFAAKFKTIETAKAFAKAFEEARDFAKGASKAAEAKEVVKKDQNAKDTTKDAGKGSEVPKGFGDAFKPPPGSWECKTCLVINKEASSTCACCASHKDGAKAPAAAAPPAQTLFQSKPMVAVPPKNSGFSFGLGSSATPTATSAATTAAPSSTSSAATEKPAGGGFMFSAMKSAATAAPAANVASNESAPPKPTFSFSAGAASKGSLSTASSAPSFNFSLSSPASTTTAASGATQPKSSVTFAAPSFVPPTSTTTAAAAPVTPATFSFKLPADASKPKPAVAGSAAPTFGGPPTFGGATSFKFGGALASTAGGNTPTAAQPTTAASENVPKAVPAKPFGSSLFGASAATSTGSVFGGGVAASGGFAALAARAGEGSAAPKGEDGAQQTISPFAGGKFNAARSIFSTLKKDGSPKSPEKEVKRDDESAEDFVPTAHFEPAVPLPALVEVKTGEEDEKVLFKSRTKLFRYVAASNEYKERGVGEIKILLNEKNGRSRVVMRRDQVLKVCANVPIHGAMKICKKPGTDNTCMFQCKDFSEDAKGVDECFVARFKEASLATHFIDVFNGAIRDCQSKLPKVKPEGSKATMAAASRAELSDTSSSKASTSGAFGSALVAVKLEDDERDEDEEEGEYEGEEDEDDAYEELGDFPAKITISDAFTSPLKQSKSVEVKGSYSMGISHDVGKIRIDVLDENGEVKLSHYVERNDKFDLKEPSSLQYIAIDEKSKSHQLLVEFETRAIREEVLANLEEGKKLAAEAVGDLQDD